MNDSESVVTIGLARLTAPGSRRAFLRLASALGGAVALASCGDDDDDVTGPGDGIALDFAQPVEVLKYAFALQTLEADFHTRVAARRS